jgi:hypothetical protein
MRAKRANYYMVSSGRAEAELFAHIENALTYAQATVNPLNNGNLNGDWVEVQKGRADSSYRLLKAAKEDLAKLRELIARKFPELESNRADDCTSRK